MIDPTANECCQHLSNWVLSRSPRGSDSKMPTDRIIPRTPPVPMFRTASSMLEIRGFCEANDAELAMCRTHRQHRVTLQHLHKSEMAHAAS